MGRVRDSFQAAVAAKGLKPDTAQAPVVERLDALAVELERKPGNGLLSRLGRAPAAPKGLYIHGDVGRGKTMLMDLFFKDVRIEPKRRVHFHAFMQDVHARLHAARQRARDPIKPVARDISREARLICLDEMQIADIADAMIVGRLFEALLENGTVVVTTANFPPEGLYKDGLNRQLFIPFIGMMREKLEVVSLDGATDYRLGRVKAHETFLFPLGPETDAMIQSLWTRLTDVERGEPADLEILGRKLHVPETAHGCARFRFCDLCEKPLGPADYLAIARAFRTVFVERIPVLGKAQRNEAKRFILLIDALYDARARLVASSAKAPEGIYADGSHRFEFGRTISRLKEMQAASWWGKKIVET